MNFWSILIGKNFKILPAKNATVHHPDFMGPSHFTNASCHWVKCIWTLSPGLSSWVLGIACLNQVNQTSKAKCSYPQSLRLHLYGRQEGSTDFLWTYFMLWLNFNQWKYHAIQNEGAEAVHFGQCLHCSRDCGKHSDNRFAVQECESCPCSSWWLDKTVELNSQPADLVKIKLLLIFTQYRSGILTEWVCNYPYH